MAYISSFFKWCIQLPFNTKNGQPWTNCTVSSVKWHTRVKNVKLHFCGYSSYLRTSWNTTRLPRDEIAVIMKVKYYTKFLYEQKPNHTKAKGKVFANMFRRKCWLSDKTRFASEISTIINSNLQPTWFSLWYQKGHRALPLEQRLWNLAMHRTTSRNRCASTNASIQSVPFLILLRNTFSWCIYPVGRWCPWNYIIKYIYYIYTHPKPGIKLWISLIYVAEHNAIDQKSSAWHLNSIFKTLSVKLSSHVHWTSQ